MTKKHFEAIAKRIRRANFESFKEKLRFIGDIGKYLEGENKNFNKQKFVSACFDIQKEFESKSEMRRIMSQVQ